MKKVSRKELEKTFPSTHQPSDGNLFVEVITPDDMARRIFNGVIHRWNQEHPDQLQEYAKECTE